MDILKVLDQWLNFSFPDPEDTENTVVEPKFPFLINTEARVRSREMFIARASKGNGWLILQRPGLPVTQTGVFKDSVRARLLRSVPEPFIWLVGWWWEFQWLCFQEPSLLARASFGSSAWGQHKVIIPYLSCSLSFCRTTGRYA